MRRERERSARRGARWAMLMALVVVATVSALGCEDDPILEPLPVEDQGGGGSYGVIDLDPAGGDASPVNPEVF